jgi:hypothetical protein
MTDLRTVALRALAYMESIGQQDMYPEEWAIAEDLRAALSIIKPEIKGHNAEPPPEAQTEAEKIAYCAGWWAAMEAKREQNLQEKLLPWKGLTEEEHNYYKACGFVGVKAVEEKLRAKNSTLACIPAVPPG